MGTRERIGIFGGTFDPVHIGHLVAAQNARDECGLDRVLMMVAGEPWQKSQVRTITDAEARFQAVRAAVEDCEGLEASRIEVDRKGPSFTAETLSTLREAHPAAELFLILGTDAALKVPTWRDPETVARLAELVVVNRPGDEELDLASFPPRWRVRRARMPALNISSTDLRERLRNGRPVRFLVPDAALALVQTSWGYDGGKQDFD